METEMKRLNYVWEEELLTADLEKILAFNPQAWKSAPEMCVQ